MPLDPDREIYPSAPLKLVAFELRFPRVPAFESEVGQQALYEGLRELLPIPGPPPVVEIHVNAGGGREVPHGMRLLDRRRRWTMTATDQALTVETSAYERFEHFLVLLESVLLVANEVGRLPAMQRVGLRYIDEIVVPGVEDVDQWREYVVDDLLLPAVFHGYPTVDWRGGLGLQAGADHRVGVRFGIVDSPVVDPTGPLRIADSPEGRYFLLDIDSAWTAPPDEYPEFDVRRTLDLCDQLHDPIRVVFERAIKDRLRDEVLRREKV